MSHSPAAAAWLVWLETSAPGVAMRQWLWLYPIVEILHIAGFVVLVGAAVMFDLRLLGMSRRRVPVYGSGGVSLYFINATTYSAKVAVAFNP